MKQKKILPVTIAVTAVCGACFLLCELAGMENYAESLILCGAFYKPFILCGEYWRFLTAGFLHGGILHLLVNLMSLWRLGSFMELRAGSLRYLVILLGSVIGGSLFTFCGSGNTIAVGLSGGLYGLLGGFTLIMYSMDLMKVPSVRRALIHTYTICLLMNFMPSIAVSAHIGGFIAGIFLTALLVKEAGNRIAVIHVRIAFVLYCAVLGAFTFNSRTIPAGQVYLLSDYNILKKETQIGFADHAYDMAVRLDELYGSEGTLTWLIGKDR